MLINIIIDVVLFIVFIGCTLLLVMKKYLRNEYEYIFYTDEVLKVEESNGLTSYLFEGPVETQQYINEYILCKRKRKKYFMCEYGKDVKSIQYYVLAYNANRKLINVIQVKERRPNSFSKMIKLPKKTRAVNFVIHKTLGFVDAHNGNRILMMAAGCNQASVFYRCQIVQKLGQILYVLLFVIRCQLIKLL